MSATNWLVFVSVMDKFSLLHFLHLLRQFGILDQLGIQVARGHSIQLLEFGHDFFERVTVKVLFPDSLVDPEKSPCFLNLFHQDFLPATVLTSL